MWRLLGIFAIAAVIGLSIGATLALIPPLTTEQVSWNLINSAFTRDPPLSDQAVVPRLNSRPQREVRWSFDDLEYHPVQRLWTLGRLVAPELRMSLEERLADLSSAAGEPAPLDPMVVWMSSKLEPPARPDMIRLFRHHRWADADPLIIVATDNSDLVRWVHVRSRFIPVDALEQLETLLAEDAHLDVAMVVDALADLLASSNPG